VPEEHHPHEPHVDIHAGGLVLDTHSDPTGKSQHKNLLRSARQACARWETRLTFTCALKSSSTLLQLLARFRIRIFTRSVYRL
jgi:hypothetical protein